jgi:neprilysin
LPALTTFGVAPTQETALEMIHTIREAFNELLAENDWMDNETRAVAKEKADQMNERIGYPELLTNPKELSSEYIMVSASNNLRGLSHAAAFCFFVVSH